MFGFSRPALLPEGQWLAQGEARFWLPWKVHASAKRLKLLMTSDGPRLTLPARATERAARAFVAEHQAWLWAQWQKHNARCAPELQLSQPLDLPWLGQQLPVYWRTDRVLAVFHESEHWRIHVSARSSVRQLQSALKHEYSRLGHAWFTTRMQRYLADLPSAPSVIRVKPLRTLWGSLAANNAMNLDSALLFAPEPVAEYVLVHELCHILQRNHSPKFWNEVERRCPNWRSHRDYLSAHGATIKAEARRLLG